MDEQGKGQNRNVNVWWFRGKLQKARNSENTNNLTTEGI